MGTFCSKTDSLGQNITYVYSRLACALLEGHGHGEPNTFITAKCPAQGDGLNKLGVTRDQPEREPRPRPLSVIHASSLKSAIGRVFTPQEWRDTKSRAETMLVPQLREHCWGRRCARNAG